MHNPIIRAGSLSIIMKPYQAYLPALCAVIGSLALTLLSIYFNPILARDSALYVDIASTFASEGFANPTKRFDWPWLPVIIALIHKGTGLTLISSGHLLMAVLMAGTCALLTRATQLLNPAAAWWGCLVSLSLPAFNGYRDTILREPGFWMFTALSMLAVGLWSQQTRMRPGYLALAVCSIIAAMCFRLEAAFLFGALGLAAAYQYAPFIRRHKGALLLSAGLLLLLIVGVSYLVTPHLSEGSRIYEYVQLLNPSALTSRLDSSAALLAEHVLQEFSHDDAGLILVFGFFGAILFNSLKLLGPFIITLVIAGRGLLKRPVGSISVYALSGVGLYFLVLMIFFIQQRFMIDRYTVLFHVLAAPLIALSAWQFQRRSPVSGQILAAVTILLALSNVISLSDKRIHYIPAGEWINQHLPADSPTYYADGRISFYAQRQYQPPSISEEQALGPQFSHYDYFLMESDEVGPLIKERLQTGQLELLAEFSNGGRRQLIILGKPDAPRL